MKGYVQVYTGNAKDNTNAALGLSVRAAGAGLKVYIAQFLKPGDGSEYKALHTFSDRITIEQLGPDKFITGKPSSEDIAAAKKGLQKVKAVLASKAHDVLVLEGGNPAAACGLIARADLLDLIAHKPANMELIITGCSADPAVVEKADLVTEMKAVKHDDNREMAARIGMEK